MTVTITKSRSGRFGTNCEKCPLRLRCTTSPRGRAITLHGHHRLLAAARRQADTKEFADIYGRGFYRDSGGAYTTDTIKTLLGRPPRRYDDFARDYADAFR